MTIYYFLSSIAVSHYIQTERHTSKITWWGVELKNTKHTALYYKLNKARYEKAISLHKLYKQAREYKLENCLKYNLLNDNCITESMMFDMIPIVFTELSLIPRCTVRFYHYIAKCHNTHFPRLLQELSSNSPYRIKSILMRCSPYINFTNWLCSSSNLEYIEYAIHSNLDWNKLTNCIKFSQYYLRKYRHYVNWNFIKGGDYYKPSIIAQAKPIYDERVAERSVLKKILQKTGRSRRVRCLNKLARIIYSTRVTIKKLNYFIVSKNTEVEV